MSKPRRRPVLCPPPPSHPRERPSESPGPILAGLALWILLGLQPASLLAAPEPLPWDGPAFSGDPAEMQATAEALPAPEDADVEVLLAETELTVEAEGLRRYRQRLVYRILKPAGLGAWATVESPWSPWYQKRPEIHARVITPGGRVHELDPATVGEAPGAPQDPEVFRDTRQLQAPLPAIQVGSLVETLVEVEHKEPFFAEGETRRHWLAMTVPVRRARVTLDAPADLEVKIATGGLEEGAEIPRETSRETPGGEASGEKPRRRRLWELSHVEPVLFLDPGLPPDEPMAPFVAFSTGSSWGDLARSYSQVVDEQIGASTEHAAELAAFAGDGGDVASQWERIQQLMASLHRQVRYTGVQFGDAGIVPRAPHETLSRRFGDCKDKAVLLTALLRREGIPAYLALLNTGPGPDALPELPGLGLFDHTVVYVPGGSPLWIDATDPYSPLGELPAGDEGRWALVASPNTANLIRTPAPKPEDNHTHEVREIFLAPLGAARVVETSELRGQPAWEIRAGWARSEPEEIRQGLEEYMSETYGATKLTRLEHTPPEDTTRPLRIELEAEGATHGSTDLQQALVVLSFSPLFDRLPAAFFPREGEVGPPRERDFVLREPYRTTWEYRLHLPENLELREMPENFERRLGPAVFSQDFEVAEDGRTVIARVLFDTGARRYTPADVTAFQEGVLELDEQQRGQLVVWLDQTVQARLAGEGVPAAVAEARRLIALEPEKALPRALLSRVLLTGGLGEEARRVAEEAAALEPDATVGHQLLAWARVHDPVGRQFRPGYDREGALAAYRRALELDPDDELTRTDYAILLEHDAEGERYSRDADLDAAIIQYRKALEIDDSNAQIVDNLLIALMWDERFEELREELERHGETPGRAYLSLLASAVLDGPRDALRTARRELGDLTTRVESLTTAARHLMLLRRYEAAAALFHGTGRDAPNAAALLAMGELVGRMRTHESLEPDETTPEGLFQSLFIELATTEHGEDDEAIPAELVRLLAPSLRREIRTADPEAAAALLDTGLRRELDAAGLPVDVLLDLVLASFTATPQETTPHGERVTLRFSLGGESNEAEAFLMPEGGAYRLVAGDDAPGMAGYEVLARLDRGDLEGARAWLDLIHGAVPPAVDPEEPLSGVPFQRIWSPANEATEEESTEAGLSEREPAGAAEMRTAAAVLLATLDDEHAARKARGLLEEARRDASPERAGDLDLALAAVYGQLEAWSDLREAGERLLAAEPDSDLALTLTLAAYQALEDPEGLRRIARRRLERDPEDFRARIGLYEAATLEGDLETTLSILTELTEGSSATSTIYNNAAWYALIRGRPDEQALRWAQEAAERSGYQERSTLHTLASIYAERERPEEAYRVLLQGMEVTDEPPDSADWYVLGRLAELYGLPEAARRYYERVERPDGKARLYDSAWALAQRRLEGMPGRTPGR